jgi:hypothetical protein
MDPKHYGALMLVALLACIGAAIVTVNYMAPDGKMIQNDKPPASISLELYHGELLVEPIDKFGESTKAPGSITVDISRVDTMDKGELSSTPQISTMARIDNFKLYYINHLGYDDNIYAARTGVHLPSDQQLYITRVTYYPDGERYHLSNSTFSRGDEQV